MKSKKRLLHADCIFIILNDFLLLTIALIVLTERYVPKVTGRETSEQQKLRLQEKMSGLKYFTVQDALKLNQRNRFSESEDTKPIDPVDECKYEHLREVPCFYFVLVHFSYHGIFS